MHVPSSEWKFAWQQDKIREPRFALTQFAIQRFSLWLWKHLFSKCWMVVIISNTGKDHSKPYVFPAYIPASNYQRVIILRLKLVRQPCLFSLRILRFSFFLNIFPWATSNEQVLLLQFEQQTRFSYPVTIQTKLFVYFQTRMTGMIPDSQQFVEFWGVEWL